MKIDLFEMQKMITVNNLQEVTNPVMFDPGFYPTQDGLLSYTIFGLPGSRDRKEVFGYIDLKKNFLHPLLYKILTAMNRKLIKVIDGSGYFKITPKGELVEDNENGETGIEWLYKNFEKLRFEKTDSVQRDANLLLLKNLKKNEIFINKFLVIPAGYRDIDTSKLKNGKPSRDILNSHYTTLISLCQSSNNDFDFMGHLIEGKIQLKLVDLYEKLTAEISGGTVSSEKVLKRGKEALFKRYTIGKTCDYSTRSVVSASRIKTNTAKEQLVKFASTGIPVAHLCNLFFPFFQYEIKNWLEEIFATVTEIQDVKTGEMYTLDNPMSYYSPERIKNLILLFIKSPENRFDTFKVPCIDKKGKKVEKDFYIFVDDLKRPFLLLDMMFIIAHQVCKDKYVYITRYPVDNLHNIYPSRIKIITTYKTAHQQVGSMYFDEYPKIDASLDSPVATKISDFIDTVIPHNSYLKALGMDFDGDTISIRGVYSQEANQEAERLINSITYIVDSMGGNVRTLKNEGIQTLFTLTKDPSKNKKIRVVTDEEKKYLLALKSDDITLELIKELFTISEKRPKKKFEPEDQLVLKAKEFYNEKQEVTTVGRFIVNKCLFSEKVINLIGYQNTILTDKEVSKLDNKILQLIIDEKLEVQEFHNYIDNISWLAYAPVTYLCPGLCSDLYAIDKDIVKLKNKLINENKEAFQNTDIFTIEKVEKQLLDASKEKAQNCSGYEIFESGARGSYKNNYKNCCLMRGTLVDFAHPGQFNNSTASLVEGLTKEDFDKSANILISGSYARARSTVTGGYLAKQIRSGFQHLVLDKKGSDCKSKRYFEVEITDSNKKLFHYRYIMDGSKEVCLSPDIIGKYVGKKVKMRSPLYCTSEKICNKCAGDLYYRLDFNNIGILLDTAAGVILNKSMKMFHDATVNITTIDYKNYIRKVK